MRLKKAVYIKKRYLKGGNLKMLRKAPNRRQVEIVGGRSK